MVPTAMEMGEIAPGEILWHLPTCDQVVLTSDTSAGIETSVFTAYGTYNFQGFYPIPSQGGILKTTSNAEQSSSMTPDVCGAFCMGSGFFYIQKGPLLSPKRLLYP